MTVSLESLKAHLVIEHDDDDALLTEKIAAAESLVATHLGYDPATEYPDGVPEAINEAVRYVAAQFYEYRTGFAETATGAVLPAQAYDVIKSFRRWSFGHDA